MILLTNLSVLILTFAATESKRCNVAYVKYAFPILGNKPSFEFYPWYSFQPTAGDVKYYKIQRDIVKHVCKASLPDHVVEVVLSEINLEYIQPGYFDKSNAQQVIIQGNKLKTVQDGVFNGTGIISLMLTDNQIETIEAKAFRDMSRLEALALDDNKIQIWDPNWLENSKVLYEISIRHNLLTVLPEGSTKNMLERYEKFSSYIVHGSIHFDNNNIQVIHSRAFSNLEHFGAVSLNNNGLLELNDGVFKGFKFLFGLYMNTNRFICFSNETVRSFRGVKRLFLGNNRINKDCVDVLQDYFVAKNDQVYL